MEIRETKASIHCSIEDDGKGMDEATLQKLFVPYFTTKAEGSGLGLAIVHRIIAEHGGSIRVDSQAGVGSRFAIRLPRHAAAHDATHDASQAPGG